jgi:hypothetical protein
MLNKILPRLVVVLLLGGCGAGQLPPKMPALGEVGGPALDAGTTLELVEVSRRTGDDGTTLIEYEPRASGQPRGKEYIFRGCNTVSELREIRRFVVDTEGRPVTKSSGEPIANHQMVLGQFQRGLVIMAAREFDPDVGKFREIIFHRCRPNTKLSDSHRRRKPERERHVQNPAME